MAGVEAGEVAAVGVVVVLVAAEVLAAVVLAEVLGEALAEVGILVAEARAAVGKKIGG